MSKYLIIKNTDGSSICIPKGCFVSEKGKPSYLKTRKGLISQLEFYRGNYKLTYPDNSNKLPDLINLNSSETQNKENEEQKAKEEKLLKNRRKRKNGNLN